MAVVSVDGPSAEIVGVMERYCIYPLEEVGLAIEPGSGVCLANICPALPLLSQCTDQIDRQNAQSVLLRDLFALQQFGLTVKQAAALEELTSDFVGDNR